MDVALTFVICTIALIAVSVLGAIVPFVKKLTDEKVHMLIALSAGIFLGLLFFMLLPETIHEGIIEGGLKISHVLGVVMGGFLLIMLINVLIKYFHGRGCACECHNEEHDHGIVSISAFIGLAIHAFIDGLLLATMLMTTDTGAMFAALVGMCVHKFVELFSLSSTFLLTDMTKKKKMIWLGAFTLITPIGAIISFLILNGAAVDGASIGIPFAFSAGTFMYVTFCELIPEAFHRRKNGIKSFILMMVGVAIAAAVFIFFGHSH